MDDLFVFVVVVVFNVVVVVFNFLPAAIDKDGLAADVEAID